MSSTNIATLTQSHHAIAAKKRIRANQLKEILFDEDARREFLTGFHKRKLAKQAAAKKKAIEREKHSRLEARREQRRALREQAAQNAAQVEKAYGGIQDDSADEEDEEWTGISRGREEEAEYEGEEIVATVTVVDDFDPSEIIHGSSRTKLPPLGDPTQELPSSPAWLSRVDTTSQLNSTSHTAQTTTSRPKPKKIKYETKDARKAQRMKQRARRTEKAERAGGKAARKRSANKGKRR